MVLLECQTEQGNSQRERDSQWNKRKGRFARVNQVWARSQIQLHCKYWRMNSLLKAYLTWKTSKLQI